MTARFELEVFDLPAAAPEPALRAAEAEDLRLAAFEQGYTAGWDDAVAAQDTEQARLRADLGRNLQDLSFTYHEARGHVLRALEPLLHDMVGKVLPEIGRAALARIVLETLLPLAEEMASAPITVIASAATRPQVEPLLAGPGIPPLRFVEEPSLGDGQVYLRLGETEARVDLDGVIAAIGAAVSAFFQIAEEDRAHG